MRTSTTGSPRGFTLLEMLAVVALLSMVASICLGALASAFDAATTRALAAAARELDARGRVAARALGAVDLVAEPGASTLSTRLASTGEVLASVDVGSDRSVRLADANGNDIAAVRIDRAGRSIDYAATIASSGAATTLRIAGLTGLVAEDPR